jgi:hypothetical protein
MNAKNLAKAMSSAHLKAKRFPQLTAILPIFLAKGKPIVLTNFSAVLSNESSSFCIMAVTSLASFELLTLSTYLTVRSIVARSTRLRVLYQVPFLSAAFLANVNFLADIVMPVFASTGLASTIKIQDVSNGRVA